jgi:hypothetical protein
MSYNAADFLAELFAPTPAEADIRVEDLDADWRVWFEERAAIMEYDGGLSRERAEAMALAETIRLMREQIENLKTRCYYVAK